jgi:hypothetical protein
MGAIDRRGPAFDRADAPGRNAPALDDESIRSGRQESLFVDVRVEKNCRAFLSAPLTCSSPNRRLPRQRSSNAVESTALSQRIVIFPYVRIWDDSVGSGSCLCFIAKPLHSATEPTFNRWALILFDRVGP